MNPKITVEKHERTYRYYQGRLIEKPRVRDHIYIWPKGEGVFENFVNRFDRPTKAYRQFLPAIFEQAGVEPAKVVWSQKAGCGCGCSPAFIVQGTRWGFDLHVEIEDAPRVEDTEDALTRRTNRAMALVNDPTIPVTL